MLVQFFLLCMCALLSSIGLNVVHGTSVSLIVSCLALALSIPNLKAVEVSLPIFSSELDSVSQVTPQSKQLFQAFFMHCFFAKAIPFICASVCNAEIPDIFFCIAFSSFLPYPLVTPSVPNAHNLSINFIYFPHSLENCNHVGRSESNALSRILRPSPYPAVGATPDLDWLRLDLLSTLIKNPQCSR